jgi:hypothetical protein
MIIQNGDHAEFEREHADTKPEDRPDWPLPSFDARDWAKAFVKMHGGDEGLMQAWFANALMRGYDEGGARRTRDAVIAEGRAAYRVGVTECPPFKDADMVINWKFGWRWEKERLEKKA